MTARNAPERASDRVRLQSRRTDDGPSRFDRECRTSSGGTSIHWTAARSRARGRRRHQAPSKTAVDALRSVYLNSIHPPHPETQTVAESHWSLDPDSHPLTVGALLDCVAELGVAAQGLVGKRALFDGDGGWRVFQAIVRQISVPLRKLCLDDEGALLRKVVADPIFHPFGGVKGRYRQVRISWRTDREELVPRIQEWETGDRRGFPRQSTPSRSAGCMGSTFSRKGGALCMDRSTCRHHGFRWTTGSR